MTPLPYLVALSSALFAPAMPHPGDSVAAVKTTYIVEKVRGDKVVPAELNADSIVVEKKTHRLSLYYQGTLLRSYLVALGRNPLGDKVSAGDNRTPEGIFHIAGHNPDSRYYRSLRISYPDVTHRLRADSLGVSPGGDIMIHGLPRGRESVGAAHRRTDWTEGCIALTNQEIDEIWRRVPDGVPIQIKP